MNLHRTTGQADWVSVAENERNVWQRLAAQTNDVVTVANVVTMIGFALVIYGLVEIIAHRYYLGSILLTIGRLCDLADGWLADITRTKSPLGELLDAVIDKLGTAATVIALFIAAVGPWWLLAGLLLPHILIALVITAKRRAGTRIHPSRIGKLSMAAAWVGLIGLVLVSAMHIQYPHPFALAVDIIIAVSIATGLYTLIGYVRQRN